MLNALLIQLFGREVIDRLAVAGFEGAESIAAAGPERLAEEADISPALARRIIAVALEEPRDSVAADPEAAAADVPSAMAHADTPARAEPAAPAGPAPSVEAIPAAGAGGERSPAAGPAQPESGDRHVRRPFRRPHSPLAPAAEEASPPAPGRRRAAARKPAADPPPADPAPFVDDVGLVSWLASASRSGGRPAAPFSVADEILDPGPPGLSAGEPRTAPPEEAPPGVERTNPEDRRSARLVEGSFWSFGTMPAGRSRTESAAVLPERRAGALDKGAVEQRTAPTPRRRSHDGH